MREGLNNPFLAELRKLAGVEDALVVEEESDPLNPDPMPVLTQDDADAVQVLDGEDADAELQAQLDEIEAARDASGEDDGGLVVEAEVSEEWEKIAGALPEFGALAKLIEWSQENNKDVELRKQASEALAEALSGEEAYIEVIGKVAMDLFSDANNEEMLYTPEGVQLVVEQLATLCKDEGMMKQAALGVADVIHKAWDATSNFVKNVFNGPDGAMVRNATNVHDQALAGLDKLRLAGDGGAAYMASPEFLAQMDEVNRTGQVLSELQSANLQRNVGRLGSSAAGVGLAALGGKKLYDATHGDEEQTAAEEDKVLLTKEASGKLDTERPNETGGITMSQQRVRDFLKIAGAAALIDLSTNEKIDATIRKEASEHFDYIATLGRSDMDSAFVKAAQQLYKEAQLHEIVAGRHTEKLLDKVAFFLQANDMTSDELQKVAGAGSVAAKGVAGALTDAAANIVPSIDEAKESAEGAGREYVGVIPGSAPGEGGTGAAGGGLVNNMGGYNVINNPEEYDVEQTAAAIEDAVLLKQAAYNAYTQADEFIRKYVSPKR